MGSPERTDREPNRDDFNKEVWFHARSGLILKAIEQVDRRQFLSSRFRHLAYRDEVIQLIDGCSLSQPSLVARMIDELRLKGNERVLEIGTGTGYQAALLSLCAKEIYTVDFNKRLVLDAQKRLRSLGYSNIEVFNRDGCLGLPEQAPYDAIIVSAAAREIPKPLMDQLGVGGRLVIPVGYDPGRARLMVGIKYPEEFIINSKIGVAFHPLMSQQQGGWTEEKLEELLGRKISYVSRIMDSRAQELGLTRGQLLGEIGKELKVESESEEDIIRALTKVIEVPLSELKV